MYRRPTHVPSLALSALWLLAIPALAAAQVASSGQGHAGGQGRATLTTFETEDFSGSGICAACHSGLTDELGNDVSNDAMWRSTMMANAARDPLWQAKISSEIDRNPHVQEVIEDKCTRCHMGMARYQAVEVLSPGFLDPSNDLHEAAMDGVSCTLCHQVQPDSLGTAESFTGNYVIDTSTPAPHRAVFGPFEDPVGSAMRRRSGFDPVVGSHLSDSAHCGSCHTLYTPVLDADGNPLAVEFPEQTTFLEWEHSEYPETCQDCHVPDAAGAAVISNTPSRLSARAPFGRHHFVGGSTGMLELLKAHADALGVTADGAHFDDTIARTLDQLQQTTGRLAVSSSRSGSRLELTVDVENLAGHKLPTGLPSRRVWLHVLVADAQGEVLFESGKVLPDGRIEGNEADLVDAWTYEPHYDTITSPDQVQIYEPIMITFEGDVTYTLLRAYAYAKDNRLLPSGFDKATADDDFAVHGIAAVDDDFVGGSDRVTYDADVMNVTGPLNVTVELLFQALSPPFVDDLLETQTDLVGQFSEMYDPTVSGPVVLDVKHVAVE